MVNDCVLIIPAYNPKAEYLSFLTQLYENGYNQIIIVDDGSDNSEDYFRGAEKLDCTILTHSINLGQGRAYKTAFNYYLLNIEVGEIYENTLGVIQCDCDGQHHIEDINKCAALLRENPQKFILGVRSFSDKSVPFRSRFGNYCTSFVFSVFCGLKVKDTQTGLKGIPKSFIPTLMEAPGERFEYASSCLLETRKMGIEILQFPIKTIYINDNESSHFNPLIDSVRIYSLILKFLISSLSSFVLDIALFSLFISMLDTLFPNGYIVLSTYLAKVFSCTYGYFVNKKMVFRDTGRSIVTAIKFFSLCVAQSTCSGFLTNAFVARTGWYEVLCKIIVDTVLFFVSFQIQNKMVFNSHRATVKMLG